MTERPRLSDTMREIFRLADQGYRAAEIARVLSVDRTWPARVLRDPELRAEWKAERDRARAL